MSEFKAKCRKIIPLPGVAPGAEVVFYNGGSSGHLIMHLLTEGCTREQEEDVFFACRMLTQGVQERAAGLPGREGVSNLFPEARTYANEGGRFRWEFWARPGTVDVEALWTLLSDPGEGGGWFSSELRKYMGENSAYRRGE